MARELDSRTGGGARAGVERSTLEARAEEIGAELRGDHLVLIGALDWATGRATRVDSVGAEPATDLVAAALEQVGAVSSLLAPVAHEEVSFEPDPTVLKTSSGGAAVHLRQSHRGIPIFATGVVVQFDLEGAVAAVSGRASDPVEIAAAEPGLTAAQALAAAARHLAEGAEPDPNAGDRDAPEPSLVWFDLDDSLRLGWELVLALADSPPYRLVVDAHAGEILYSRCLQAGVAARGTVFFPYPDTTGNRLQVQFPPALSPGSSIYPPALVPASPLTGFPRPDWVAVNRTDGNNVNAHLSSGGTVEALSGAAGPTFYVNDPWSVQQQVINLFFLLNYMHDFMYVLGFRENEVNLQKDHYTEAPLQNSQVEAIAYPNEIDFGSSTTMTSGLRPKMEFGVITRTKRHTALDGSLVFHEYTHGMTNRLIGGIANVEALEARQSQALAEGWSDYVACAVIGINVIGAWVHDRPEGIRSYPYDANFPHHYGMLGTNDRLFDPHDTGEIWSAALIEVGRRTGRLLALQAVVDGLKLTPASPDNLQARDAVLMALRNTARSRGWSANLRRRRLAEAWHAFARFGMGYKAATATGTRYTGIVADFTTPRALARVGDFDRSGKVGVLVVKSSAIAIWRYANSALGSQFFHLAGSSFAGGWTLGGDDEQLGPVGDFDGDGRAEVLAVGKTGVAIISPADKKALLTVANGSMVGIWGLDTHDCNPIAAGDFDGDGRDEILVSRTQGIAIWKVIRFSTVAPLTLSAPCVVGNGKSLGLWGLSTADNEFGPVGDFDGDSKGAKEIFISGPRGIGILKLEGSDLVSLATSGNGTLVGDWPLDYDDFQLGPVGDFDGDGCDEIFVFSSKAVAILKLSGGSLTTLVYKQSGANLGGWSLHSDVDSFGPAGDFDHDGRDEILVSGAQGIAILQFKETLKSIANPRNGEKLGNWVLNTAVDEFGPAGDFDDDDRDEILVSKPTAVGLLRFAPPFESLSIVNNRGAIGDWPLNTRIDDFGTPF